MTFDEFTDALYAAGWKSPNDAQHERIKSVWLDMETAADYRIKWAAADERLSMIRAACDNATKEGWQHLPVSAVHALTGSAAQRKGNDNG